MSAHLAGSEAMTSGTMSTEPKVSPVAETQNPAPETETPEVVAPEVEAEAEVEGEAKADDPAKAIERMQRRIDRKHAAAAKAIAENAVLKQQLDELRGKPKDDAPVEDVNQRAEQIAEARLYAKSAESIVSKGKTAQKDFLPALADLAAEVGDFVQPNGLPSNFMRAVLDVSESPSELLYHLGKNPDLAADLEGLPVTKLAARLDRIERELKDKATPKQSAAPKPLEPVKSHASDTGYLGNSKISDAEWEKRRNQELRDRHR